MSSVNVVAGDFKWSSGINLTIPKNELLAFPDIKSFPPFDAVYEVGQPILGRKQFKTLGVNPETGVYDFVDVNQDGVINDLDAQFFAPNVQEYFGGINNTFTYKGFQLDFLFDFVNQDAQVFYATLFPGEVGMDTKSVKIMSRWQNPGDVTDVQRFGLGTGVTSLSTSNSRYAGATRTDASYIRLRNLSLSWTLPAELLKAVKVQTARVYAQGQNLLTFTHYEGFDPETLSIGLPPLRMITTGIQVSF